jgi:hypothetical protein
MKTQPDAKLLPLLEDFWPKVVSFLSLILSMIVTKSLNFSYKTLLEKLKCLQQ